MSHRNYEGQVVWIIGASTGIGLALARELSAQGAILALSSRNAAALEKITAELGSHHKPFALDITDAEATGRTAQAIRAALGNINRVIYLAAGYEPMKTDALDLAETKAIVDVNLMGAFNLIHAVLPLFKAQASKAQLALCGSVAGYVGLSEGQPYSATKAAIINLAESLYAEHNGSLDIKLISPGFVRTGLTDKNDFAMPMMIEPEQAAKDIAHGLLTRRFEIHFPKKFTFLIKVLRLLPYGIALQLTQKIKK